jgi:hypothetical protein
MDAERCAEENKRGGMAELVEEGLARLGVESLVLVLASILLLLRLLFLLLLLRLLLLVHSPPPAGGHCHGLLSSPTRFSAESNPSSQQCVRQMLPLVLYATLSEIDRSFYIKKWSSS